MSALFRAPKAKVVPEPTEEEARAEAQKKLSRVQQSQLSSLFRQQSTGIAQLRASGLGGLFGRRS
jgi:hypothetical protein